MEVSYSSKINFKPQILLSDALTQSHHFPPIYHMGMEVSYCTKIYFKPEVYCQIP